MGQYLFVFVAFSLDFATGMKLACFPVDGKWFVLKQDCMFVKYGTASAGVFV